MAKNLYVNGNTGAASISEGQSPVHNPLANLSRVYFHSDLDYLKIIRVVTTSVSLPQRNADGSDTSSAYGSTIYTLGNHGAPETPILLGHVVGSGQPLAGDTVLQAAGQCSIRSLALGADSQRILLREIYLNKDVSFSALSLTLRIYVFDRPVS